MSGEDDDLFAGLTNGSPTIGPDVTLDELAEVARKFDTLAKDSPRDVTLHPNDYRRLVRSLDRRPLDEEPQSPPTPFAHFTTMPVYVDDDVPEGQPEFNRPRKPKEP